MAPTLVRTRWGLSSAGASLLLAIAAASVQASEEDLTALSLEQLLNMEVMSASKFAQRMADAPASVTVLRSADIRRFGYRTLADILRSVRGFYVSSDHQYSYIGVRGFSPPGDYNTRLLVLVDGYRVNDNIYDTGAIGGEFPLDVDLIDRVEIVRGPGSSVYGGNALFGVVNVITRRGHDLNGGEASAALSSGNGREARVSWGRKLDSGLELLLSASGLKEDGPKLSFPDMAANGGISRNTDYESRRQLLAKAEYGAWNLTLMNSRRPKGLSGGAFGTDFNEPGNRIVDEQTSLNLGYYRILDNGNTATARVYAGNYQYKGYYLYSGLLNRDVAEGAWWGGEARILLPLGKHKLVYGVEYQRSSKQDQRNFDQDPYSLYLDDRSNSIRYAGYVLGDLAIADGWTLSAGLRYDHSNRASADISPRLGLIHQTAEGSVLKLLYGTAYRNPNVYERFYAYPGQQAGNPGLQSERIKTYEGVWEKAFGPDLRLVGSVYYYRIENWILQQPDPATGGAPYQYANQVPVSARGFEMEADRQWQGGTRLRTSYSAQFAPERYAGSINQAPRHLFKTNLSTPIVSDAWHAGLEYLYMSSRATRNGRVDDHGLLNTTLTYQPYQRGPELAFSLYNLLDKRYADPNTDPGVPLRESIIQDGRSWRLKLTVPF